MVKHLRITLEGNAYVDSEENGHIVKTEKLVPEKYAKWELAYMGLEIICSNCGNSPHNQMQYDYCPFCGAKMSKYEEGYQTVVCKVEDNKDDN